MTTLSVVKSFHSLACDSDRVTRSCRLHCCGDGVAVAGSTPAQSTATVLPEDSDIDEDSDAAAVSVIAVGDYSIMCRL
jgi:hypothetical protein